MDGEDARKEMQPYSAAAEVEQPKSPEPEPPKPAPPEPGPPGSIFALLMGLIWQLPKNYRIAASLAVLAVAGLIPLATRFPSTESLTSLVTGRGALLWPAVEHEEADYEIELNDTGGALWTLNFKFRRLREEATTLADMIATSGGLPRAYSHTHHPAKLTLVSERPKKQANLDRYVVKLDISNDPIAEERAAHISYVVPGGFTGRSSEWAGVLVLQPTRKLRVRIVFKPAKMGRDFKFSRYPWTAPADVTEIRDATFHVPPGGTTLVWEVQHPFLNQVYRVDWNW